MSRKFEFSVPCPLSVAQIHAAYSDEQYWYDRLATYANGELEAFDVTSAGEIQVTVVQDLRTSLLPGGLAKMYPRDLRIVQHQTWQLLDNEMRGEAHLTAQGAPGTGLSRVAMASDGRNLRCIGMVKVGVPVIGGTVEGLLERQMRDNTPELLRYTASWVDVQDGR